MDCNRQNKRQYIEKEEKEERRRKMRFKKGKDNADSWKIIFRKKVTGKRGRHVFSVIFHLLHSLSFILLVKHLAKLLVAEKNYLPVQLIQNF